MGWGLSGGNGLLNEVPHSGVLCVLHTQHKLSVLSHATREVQIDLYNISQPFLRTFVYLKSMDVLLQYVSQSWGWLRTAASLSTVLWSLSHTME